MVCKPAENGARFQGVLSDFQSIVTDDSSARVKDSLPKIAYRYDHAVLILAALSCCPADGHSAGRQCAEQSAISSRRVQEHLRNTADHESVLKADKKDKR